VVSLIDRYWRKKIEDTTFLRKLVLVKAVFVVLLLLVAWALREKDTVVAYMRF
jgi:hypothetical protein